jgi:HsdM N-terminal domain/S1/P1 Nuclease
MARNNKGDQKTTNNGANVGYEAELWQMADALRGSMDAAEYKHVVLGLIFLKYISDAFEEHHAKLEAEKAQGVTSSSNLTRLRNEATALRTRQGFQRSQLTELANNDFESWAKESFEIATKIAYRNGRRIGIPRNGNIDCAMVAAAPVLPAGYVVNASRIADRRIILAGYRLADLLRRVLKLD